LEPKSFIRAALLHIVDGRDITPLQGDDLFGQWGSTTEDPEIVARFRELQAAQRWGRELENPHILKLLFYNLRHSNDDWPLLIQGIQELLTRGPQHLLLGTGPAAHKLVLRRNQVTKEIHRLTGFTRLSPAPDGTLVGKAPAKHFTGDLVALLLARRNRDLPLALLTPTGSWFVWQGRLSRLKDANICLPEDGFSEVWLTYYKTQFIAQRNNPRHAARAIPQEYWQWLKEGQELLKAKNIYEAGPGH